MLSIENLIENLSHLGPNVNSYNRRKFEDVLRVAIEQGVEEFNITNWSYTAVRTLLDVLREKQVLPSIRNGDKFYRIMHLPSELLIDAFIESIMH